MLWMSARHVKEETWWCSTKLEDKKVNESEIPNFVTWCHLRMYLLWTLNYWFVCKTVTDNKKETKQKLECFSSVCEREKEKWLGEAKRERGIHLFRVYKRHIRWEGTSQRHKSTCDTLMLLNSTKNSPVAAGWKPQLLANWIEKKIQKVRLT